MKVYPNSSLTKIGNVSHPVFQYVEQRFYAWLKMSNPASEYREQYFGEPEFGGGCLSKKGAIQQAIENAIEEADETGKPVELSKFDLEAAFE